MSTILVLGGTGSIGRQVVARLIELGDTARVLTRNPDRARQVLPHGADVVAGDLTDTASVRAALDGATGLVDGVVMTHGAPYGPGEYADVDYGAVPVLLEALGAVDGRSAPMVPVVLMSSIGVTATGGSSRDLLNWKRRGERLLRASGLPYTIVRPGWFDADTGTEQHVDLRQGDQVDYGPVRREHVAETITQAVRTDDAAGRTVEVFSTDGPPVTDWPSAFAATDADRSGDLDGAHDRTGLPVNREPGRVKADLTRFQRRH